MILSIFEFYIVNNDKFFYFSANSFYLPGNGPEPQVAT